MALFVFLEPDEELTMITRSILEGQPSDRKTVGGGEEARGGRLPSFGATWQRAAAALLFLSSPCGAQGIASAVDASRTVVDTITRDPGGKVTVRATRLDAPLRLDGELDEAAYALVSPFGGFIQQEPNDGEPATDRTDVWVFFDDRNVYVSVRVWYARPDTIVANELRRDAPSIWATNDNIGIVLDTLNDRRSGYYVNTNALGAIRDVQLTDEDRNVNFQFDMVWDVKSRRFRDGWTTETAIPFKSLHYQAGRQQVWGLNIQRVDRGKNEFSHLAAIPASYGPAGVFRVSVAASLVGIEAPPTAGRLELKPYAVSAETTTAVVVVPAIMAAAVVAGMVEPVVVVLPTLVE
jgi:hypothetical protein